MRVEREPRHQEVDGAKPPARKERLRVKLLLIFFGLVAGLLIVEAGLRIIGYSFPIFYTVDQDRGIALRASVEGWYRREGRNYVRINSDGLRDREHAKSKPPGTLRIAVIGDSYAEALQVPMENAFWAVLEQELVQCGKFSGQQVEVINFGVSGYGTAQELLTLRTKVWDYSPDIVLLAVCTGNDITDNSRSLKKANIPYFVYRNENLVLDNSFQDSRTFRLQNSALTRAGMWLRDRLRFVQAIHEAQLVIKTYIAQRRARSDASATAAPTNTAPDKAAANKPDAARSEELGLDNLIYSEPIDPAWTDAWRVTESLITTMNDEVKSRGAQFLVVTLSNGIQVHPFAQARRDFMQRVGATDLFYPDERIRALGERKGFAVLSLAPALQSYAEQHKVFLHGFGENIGNGHWNTTGHAIAGHLIAEKVCEGYDR